MRHGRYFAAALACLLAATVLTAGCGGKKPVLSSINPTSSEAGLSVTLAGRDFGESRGGSSVLFGDRKAAVETWTDTTVTALVPGDMKAGACKVTVTTGGGTSEALDFMVLKKGAANAVTPGEIEHATVVQAIEAWLAGSGVDTSRMTFGVYSVSAKNPGWKIDNSFKGNTLWGQFLLHNTGGNWTVIEAKQAITAGDLKENKAPGDLLPSNPPAPAPPEEAEAITGYLKAKGQPGDGWAFRVAKVSGEDPDWEIVAGNREGSSKNFLVIRDGGGWKCLADGGPPWTGVEHKGAAAPGDLDTP